MATSGSRRFPICNRTEKDCSRLRGTRGPRGEKYTIRFPKNFPPTAANQLKFDQRELNIIGRWSPASKMPERYDRSACANELLLRNTVIRRAREGWAVPPASHLPLTVVDTTRIGCEAELTYTKSHALGINCPPSPTVRTLTVDWVLAPRIVCTARGGGRFRDPRSSLR